MPVVSVTARTETAKEVAGLELGADDHLTEPIEGPELVARIPAVLRGADGKKPCTGYGSATSSST